MHFVSVVFLSVPEVAAAWSLTAARSRLKALSAAPWSPDSVESWRRPNWRGTEDRNCVAARLANIVCFGGIGYDGLSKWYTALLLLTMRSQVGVPRLAVTCSRVVSDVAEAEGSDASA